MALINVIGRCKRHDAIHAVPLFEHTFCVDSLFACKFDHLDIFFQLAIEMNVNISNKIIFSDVHTVGR